MTDQRRTDWWRLRYCLNPDPLGRLKEEIRERINRTSIPHYLGTMLDPLCTLFPDARIVRAAWMCTGDGPHWLASSLVDRADASPGPDGSIQQRVVLRSLWEVYRRSWIPRGGDEGNDGQRCYPNWPSSAVDADPWCCQCPVLGAQRQKWCRSRALCSQPGATEPPPDVVRGLDEMVEVSRPSNDWCLGEDCEVFLKAACVPLDTDRSPYNERTPSDVVLLRMPVLFGATGDGESQHEYAVVYVDVFAARYRDGSGSRIESPFFDIDGAAHEYGLELRRMLQELADELITPSVKDMQRPLAQRLTSPRVGLPGPSDTQHSEVYVRQASVKWPGFRYHYFFSRSQRRALLQLQGPPECRPTEARGHPRAPAETFLTPPTLVSVQAGMDSVIVRTLHKLDPAKIDRDNAREWFRWLFFPLVAPPNSGEDYSADYHAWMLRADSKIADGPAGRAMAVLETVAIAGGPISRAVTGEMADYQRWADRDPMFARAASDYSPVVRELEGWLLLNQPWESAVAVPLLLPDDQRCFGVLLLLLDPAKELDRLNSGRVPDCCLAQIGSLLASRRDEAERLLGDAYVDDLCTGFYKETQRQFQEVLKDTSPEATRRVAERMMLWLAWYTPFQDTALLVTAISGEDQIPHVCLDKGNDTGVLERAPRCVQYLYFNAAALREQATELLPVKALQAAPSAGDDDLQDRLAPYSFLAAQARLGDTEQVFAIQRTSSPGSARIAPTSLLHRLADGFRAAWEGVRFAEVRSRAEVFRFGAATGHALRSPLNAVFSALSSGDAEQARAILRGRLGIIHMVELQQQRRGGGVVSRLGIRPHCGNVPEYAHNALIISKDSLGASIRLAAMSEGYRGYKSQGSEHHSRLIMSNGPGTHLQWEPDSMFVVVSEEGNWVDTRLPTAGTVTALIDELILNALRNAGLDAPGFTVRVCLTQPDKTRTVLRFTTENPVSDKPFSNTDELCSYVDNDQEAPLGMFVVKECPELIGWRLIASVQEHNTGRRQIVGFECDLHCGGFEFIDPATTAPRAF